MRTPSNWSRIRTLFQGALERPPDQRTTFLRDQTDGDDTIRREVESLLAAHLDASTFLETSAFGLRRDGATRPTTRLVAGSRLGVFEILEPLGAGGMGEVYKARDTRLDRLVAVKFLLTHAAADPAARRRFEREARSISRLNHPHICTLHDIGSACIDGVDAPFLVMELLDGETLATRLSCGPLTIEQAVDFGIEIAEALAAAHARGVVHCDLKPANIMLTDTGVKLLDFGLARLRPAIPAGEFSAQVSEVSVTAQGMVAGTLPYMSPEQMKGHTCDPRTDLFAYGAVLYEMLTGVRAFAADSQAQLIADILDRDPAPLATRQPGIPERLERLVTTCLAKNPDDRWQHANDVAVRLREFAAEQRTAGHATASRWQSLRRPRIAIPLTAVLLAGILAGIVVATNVSNQRWAKTVALPEIARLAEGQDFVAAVDLASQAHAFIPNDAELLALWPRITRTAIIGSEPAGTRISYARYGADAPWRTLGTTPLAQVRLPMGLLRLKAEKPGLVTAEDITFDSARIGTPLFRLVAPAATPAGMVRASPVRGNRPIFVFGGSIRRADINGFWIDRYEVTNRQYKAFLDAGGYMRPEFWTHPFVQGGRTISFDEAVGKFRDATGRLGPATWTLGNYASGEDELPVSGVSWYEASAYAAFAGGSLPTVYHWYWVASQELTEFVAPLANHSSLGPVAADRARGLHRFGAYGLAGNVKEWCFNEASGNRRYILGGGWDEPPYSFGVPDARSPFDRERNFGFRIAKYDDGDRSVGALSGMLLFPSRSYANKRSVGDREFQAYQRVYSYDRADLAAKVESVDDTHASWRVERVSFRAAYGQERMLTYLLLPTQGQPPYHTIVYMPGGDAWDQRTSPDLANPRFAFLLKSGRAVAFPIYKGAYERAKDDFVGSTLEKSTSRWRDHVIMWSKDVRRTLDYLASRTDIDSNKIGFLGISRGGALAPVMLAPEPRIKVAALWVPGFYPEVLAPEVDPSNFAPRVTIPILQLSGRYDYVFPEDTSSLPFFRAFGTRPDQRRRRLYDTGHNLPPNETIRETLDWFDLHLGSPRHHSRR